MKQKTKNFASPIHLACSNDLLRPALQLVNFEDGYIWATSGHVLARQSLSTFHGFDETEISLLNGKRIHKDVFKLILQYDIIKIEFDGIRVFLGDSDMFISYSKSSDKSPDYKQAIRSSVETIEPVDAIGINAKFIDIANKILQPFNNQLELNFTKHNKAIFAGCQSYSLKNSFVMIMPIMFTEGKNKLTDLV